MAVPKFITNDMKGGYVGGPTTPVRRGYVGSGLVYQGFSPASEQEFIEQEATGGPAELLKVYGKSIVWNQLVSNRDFSGGTTNWAAIRGTLSVVDNVATLVANGTGAAMLKHTSVFTASHKYYVKVSLTAAQACRVRNGNVDAASLILHQLTANVPSVITEIYAPTVNTDAMTQYSLIMNGVSGGVPSAGDSIDVRYVDIIDLTLLYGAGNEPTSVAQFEADYPTYNPAYNPGEVQNNATTELRAERIPVINVWDEEWEVGYINTNTGLPTSATDKIRAKNFCRCLPNTTYYKQAPAVNNLVVYFYDAEYNYLDWHSAATPNMTTPTNATYFKIAVFGSTTYNHDICINISNPAINGNYYPHWRGKLPLNIPTLTSGGVAVFPYGMAAVGTLRDEAEGSTAIKRLGAVDLGTLTYVYDASGTRFRGDGFSGNVASGSVVPVAICAIYTPITGADTYKSSASINDMTFGFSATEGRIFVRNSNYTDPAAFKTAMSGVYLFFELATPGTYTLDNALPTDLTCVQGDILQRVSDNNCPFVGEMKFGL